MKSFYLFFVVFCCCMILGIPVLAESLREAVFPFYGNVNITQPYGADTQSHANSCAVDFGGYVVMHAPFDMSVVYYQDDANGTVFQSDNKVKLANGQESYVCIFVGHCDDVSPYDIHVGKHFSQGEECYKGGQKGFAFGAHIHMECSLGRYKAYGQSDCVEWNSSGKLTRQAGPQEIFYVDRTLTTKITQAYSGFSMNFTWVDMPPVTIPINEQNFPDPIFRQYILDNIDGTRDGLLSRYEIEHTTWIYMIDRGISSLKGIEFFGYLEELHCGHNNLTELDVSQNIRLITLYCQYNKIIELDVSKNSNLSYLGCQVNQDMKKISIGTNLGTLIAYDCGNLKNIQIPDNAQLTNMDISFSKPEMLNLERCPNLRGLRVRNCDLKSLDLSRCSNLEELYCSNLMSNEYADRLNDFTELDLSKCSKLYRVECSYNRSLNRLILPQTNSLVDLECINCALNQIDVSGLSAINRLDCSNNKIKELNIGHKEQLKEFYCAGNELVQLDVSGLPNLEWIDFSENALTNINLSNNTKLETYRGNYNYYFVETDSTGMVDLSLLPGNFDITKASNWDGGTVTDHILNTVKDTVSYDYDCGNGKKVTFNLRIRKGIIVSFDAGGGSGTMNSIFLEDIPAKLVFPPNSFIAPDGKVFSHWEYRRDSYSVGSLPQPELGVDKYLPGQVCYPARSNTVTAAWGVAGVDVEARLEMKQLSTISDELRRIYVSISAIKDALYGSFQGYPNVAYYDVSILVKRDGIHWEEAGVENYPLEGIIVKLPYPPGTGKTGYRFYISHMFAHSNSRLGVTAGEIENPAYALRDDGIVVALRGASPIAIGWEDASDDKGDNEESTITDEVDLPKTGDDSNLPALCFLLLSGILGIMLLTRKR